MPTGRRGGVAEYKGLSRDGLGLPFTHSACPSGHRRSMADTGPPTDRRPDQITAMIDSTCQSVSVCDSYRVTEHQATRPPV